MPDAVAVLPPLLLLVDPFALRNSRRSLGRRGMKDRLWYSVPGTVMPTCIGVMHVNVKDVML